MLVFCVDLVKFNLVCNFSEGENCMFFFCVQRKYYEIRQSAYKKNLSVTH